MSDDVRILSVSPSLPLVPGMMTLPGLLVFTLVDSKPRASCVESSPLPDARGEGRSDGRVRKVLLLVSTSLTLGLTMSLRNLLASNLLDRKPRVVPPFAVTAPA